MDEEPKEMVIGSDTEEESDNEEGNIPVPVLTAKTKSKSINRIVKAPKKVQQKKKVKRVDGANGIDFIMDFTDDSDIQNGIQFGE